MCTYELHSARTANQCKFYIHRLYYILKSHENKMLLIHHYAINQEKRLADLTASFFIHLYGLSKKQHNIQHTYGHLNPSLNTHNAVLIVMPTLNVVRISNIVLSPYLNHINNLNSRETTH